jgi:hypothetical protein
MALKGPVGLGFKQRESRRWELPHWWGVDVTVDVLNKANKMAAELASEDGKAMIEMFISEYKGDANILNEVRSATLDITQYGADKGEKGEEMTSLHDAAEDGNLEVVQLLLERGADVNSGNADSRNTLHQAAVEGKLDVVRLLTERGAEVDPRDRWVGHRCTQHHEMDTPRDLASTRKRRERKAAASLLSAVTPY